MTGKHFSLVSLLLFIIIAAALFLCSCGAANYSDSSGISYDVAEESMPAPEYAQDSGYDNDSAINRVNGEIGESAMRYVIRNGSIDLAVKDTRETMREIRELTDNVGGLVSNSYIYEMRENQYAGYMTLRIPENRFESIMEQLEDYGKATNVQTGVDDVTMQYVDLESRLNNQIAQEERLVEILEMAETVEDVLEVERELNRIRSEIESMTAQMNHLKDQVTYATINVNLREENVPTDVVKPGAFENFGNRVRETFIGSINFLLNSVSFIVIALIALLPALILIGIVILIIRWLIKTISRKKKNKDHTIIETAEEKKE